MKRYKFLLTLLELIFLWVTVSTVVLAAEPDPAGAESSAAEVIVSEPTDTSSSYGSDPAQETPSDDNTPSGDSSEEPSGDASSDGNTLPFSQVPAYQPSQNTSSTYAATPLLPGTENHDPEASNVRDWSFLLSSSDASAAEHRDNTSPTEHDKVSETLNSNDGKDGKWILFVGILLLLLAAAGIGYVIYNICFQKPKNRV